MFVRSLSYHPSEKPLTPGELQAGYQGGSGHQHHPREETVPPPYPKLAFRKGQGAATTIWAPSGLRKGEGDSGESRWAPRGSVGFDDHPEVLGWQKQGWASCLALIQSPSLVGVSIN